jgi:hypothetical protein
VCSVTKPQQHILGSFINSNVYTGADSVACIQLWSLHEQCHQLSGWGVVSLLYLLACALQYRYLNNILGSDHATLTNVTLARFQTSGWPLDWKSIIQLLQIGDPYKTRYRWIHLLYLSYSTYIYGTTVATLAMSQPTCAFMMNA